MYYLFFGESQKWIFCSSYLFQKNIIGFKFSDFILAFFTLFGITLKRVELL
ncbi:hypothetical protein LEP1GSC073_0340 [Leptospira noguchii str. Cascata]|nr:hypothetical protein LEP1GSC072_3980 [Leptospira noguchii str. Bonito]EMS90043.1 hypothetical protein LEP1GSC073_0340 [Leptospira noguchii str. Cascata]